MSNLDLTQYIGSTSKPTGTQLAYQIDGSVIPGSEAVFKTISPSSLVLEGSFTYKNELKIMDGELEIIDQGNGSTVTVGYNLHDGTPFVTATFKYHEDAGPRLNLERQSITVHKTELESHHAAFLSMFMMIKSAYIEPVPDSSGNGTDTFLSATSDFNLTIPTTLVPTS